MLGALPLVALLLLDASPRQMGILVAASGLPALLFAFLAGAFVDRLPLRRTMVLADLGRFLLLISIPIAVFLEVLTLAQLYVVAFLAGVLDLSFSLSYRSFLPSVVPNAELVRANGKLQAAEAAATSAAPPIGGLIVQLLTAPVAVLIDALSFALSALLLVQIRFAGEQGPVPKQTILREALEGVTFLVGNRTLRALWLMVASYSLFAGGIFALSTFWALEELHLTPALLGVALGVGGVGSFLGSLIGPAVLRRLGVGPAIIGTYFLGALVAFMPPSAGFVPSLGLLFIILDYGLGDIFWVVHNIGTMSLRQSLPPASHLGRIQSSFVIAGRGMMPVGAFVGGILAESIGAQLVLFGAAAGIVASGFWLIASPLPSLRELVDDARRDSSADKEAFGRP
jgi:predicted MFS family arabinose efflux permease